MAAPATSCGGLVESARSRAPLDAAGALTGTAATIALAFGYRTARDRGASGMAVGHHQADEPVPP